jgi:thiol-disulfide isomerase/thioredoxin
MRFRSEFSRRFEALEGRLSPAAALPVAPAEPLAGEVAYMFEPYVDASAFAQALTNAGVRMFGAWWCPHCQAQKAMFGDAADELPYVECANPDRTQTQAAIDNNISSYPTWIWGDGSRKVGTLSFEEIAQMSGVALPVVTAEAQFQQALDNLMAQFGQTGQGLSADLDQDGRVDFDDFGVLKENRPAQAAVPLAAAAQSGPVPGDAQRPPA